MSFQKDLLNKLLGNNDSPTTSTAQHTVSPSTQSETNAPLNENFEKELNRLAELCKMGDAAAMCDMALLWLSDCSNEQRALLQNYESNTCEETLNELWDYMKHHRSFIEFKYYMMWVTRAAVYGNPDAKAILDRCSYYKDHAYIPYKYYVDRRTSQPYWSSNLFYNAGFCDIIRGKEDCGLIFHKDYGYFEFYYVSYYVSPDEDGFGSEIEYESVFYDEFFREIPVRCNAPQEEVLLALKKVEAEREAFWEKQEDCSKRKYISLLNNT